MSFYDLLFLGAGGAIGSGWLLGGVEADQGAGSWAVFSWLIGGVLMLVIAAVMVQLSTMAPKTGGLIFLPLQSSGPLLATVVAAGLWTFYAVNPASEAVAMTRGISSWLRWQGLVNTDGDGLTWAGTSWAVFFMLLVTMVNLLGPRLFLIINNVLTAFKILVPLLVVGLLVYAELGSPIRQGIELPHGPLGHPPPYDLGSVLTTVTSSGVIYAYLGFQGPLDFAGNVKRRGIGEAARLRRAVYGTVCGSIFLYVSLQFVVIYIRHHAGEAISATDAPYTAFAQQVIAPHWAAHLVSSLINLDTVLSPAGSALVFTYVLTREVAALSRAHLTHRGLQKSRYSVIPVRVGPLRRLFGERLDVYWLILIVDFILSTIALCLFGGDWSVLSAITSILALVVYATPSVVLAALRRRGSHPAGRSRANRFVAGAAFVSIAVIFYLAGWDLLWPGMVALTVGCVVLFAVPAVISWSNWSRWYDAKAHATQARQPSQRASAKSALLLFGFFAVLTLASLPNKYTWPTHPAIQLWIAVGVAVVAAFVFRSLVSLSVQHMEEHRPTLPNPILETEPAGAGPAAPPATAPSG